MRHPVPILARSGPRLMEMTDIPFQTTEWSRIEPTRHDGTTGFALWRTKLHGGLRLRIVEYSPGYSANHWCEKGHILFCLDGELRTELMDGRVFRLTPGMTYEVSDGAEAHRSSTTRGAKLFIVD